MRPHPARIAGAALLAAALAACDRPAGAQGEGPPPPMVGVVEIAPQPYEQTIRLTGRVQAFLVSEVRPQIGGIVRRRAFQEGARVNAGDVLYEIDPGPARAELSGAEAAAASAQARYERYQRLAETGAVSRQELDDARAAADQAQAALTNARINTGYTRVTAPISGVIGASRVTAGALAVPSQAEPFAVIQQIDQVYVDMTQSIADMMRMRDAIERAGGDRVAVRLTLPDGSQYQREGVLQFSDISVNENSGAVRLRAIFPNPEQELLPGMFVQAELRVGVNENAILAPQRAVSRNARGEAVTLVLNPENVVEERVIETGGTAGDQWIVLSGLNPGDRVIVEGVQLVRPGARATAAAPTQPPTREGDAELLRGRQG